MPTQFETIQLQAHAISDLTLTRDRIVANLNELKSLTYRNAKIAKNFETLCRLVTDNGLSMSAWDDFYDKIKMKYPNVSELNNLSSQDLEAWLNDRAK